MKKTTAAILALLTIAIFGGVQAQTQSGVVKTPGKMINGKLVPGTLLSGTTVQVEGRQAVVAKNGKFSFPVKDGKYILKSVSKQGYQLVDAEICRQYSYSATPLQIVMEEPDKLQSDQLAKERKLRRELQRRLQQREDEIEAMNIAVEEKNRMLVQLNKEREENENIIESMAKYYSTLDYDQLDAFQQSVSALLEDCQLERADSLLRTRGDMHSRVSRIQQEQTAIAREQAALAKRKKSLEESKAGTQRKLEAIAADCYNFYQRFFMAHQNDSAAYYLELRASLDTTNIQWQYEAGQFIDEYLADIDKALSYYQRYLRHALTINDGINDDVAKAYNAMGKICQKSGQMNDMLPYFQKAFDIRKTLYGENNPKLAPSYVNIAGANLLLGNYELALLHFDTVLDITKNSEKEEVGAIANAYGNKGLIYFFYKGDYQKALECYEKQKALMLQKFGDKNPELITPYDHLSEVLMGMGKIDEAMDYNQKACDLAVEFYGEKHPVTATLLHTRGKCHLYKGEPQKALEYFNQGYDIMQRVYGNDNQYVADLLVMTAYAYFSMGDFEKSLDAARKVLETHVKILGENHRATAYDYLFLANCYHGMNDFSKAMTYAQKSLEIYNKTIGPDHEETITAKQTIEEIQKDMEKSGLRD